MITKRDFILRVSCFCEKYIYIYIIILNKSSQKFNFAIHRVFTYSAVNRSAPPLPSKPGNAMPLPPKPSIGLNVTPKLGFSDGKPNIGFDV